MTQINQSEAAQFPQDRVFRYENFPEPDQSIVEQTLDHDGNYTTSKEASEFIYRTDAYQANVVKYDNESYRLVAEDETAGGGLLKIVLWIPLTLVGALLLLLGFVVKRFVEPRDLKK